MPRKKLPVTVWEDRLLFKTEYARIKAWILLEALEIPLIIATNKTIDTNSNKETLRAVLRPWFDVYVSRRKKGPLDEIPF